MAATMTDLERQQVDFLLSPWVRSLLHARDADADNFYVFLQLIGSFADFLLQGVLFMQFANYFSWYKDDKTRLRFIVAFLFILTTLKTAQTFLLVWQQQIVHFTDIEGAIELSYTGWWQTGNGLMVASIGIYVQTYFLFRLHAITRRLLFVVPIGIILLFAYLASILSVYYSTKSETRNIGIWYACHLSSVFAGDTLLAGTTAYALLTAKGEHALKQTNDIIHRLVWLTWTTITPAALCALLNLIFSQVYNGEQKLVSAAFNMALPKLYAISMMWTLNARRSIRLGHSTGNMSTSGEITGRSRRREDLELNRFGTMGTIHIRTDIETDQYADELIDPVFTSTKSDVVSSSTPPDFESQRDAEYTESTFYKAHRI